MANAFGGFQHISPLSNATSSTSHPPDPHTALSSNCVRDYFGPVVQTVADALHARGTSTLHELVSNVRHHCMRNWNEERGRLVDRLNGSVSSKRGKDPSEQIYRGGKVNMNKARGTEPGFVTDASHVRAALIVLLHHSLVKVSGGTNKHANKDPENEMKQKADPTSPHTHYRYTFLHERARLMTRYPRYVEHAQHCIDENAAQIVECLLVNGRMRCEDAIFSTWESAKRKLQLEDDSDDAADDSESNKALKDIVQSFKKLVEGGYIEMVTPISTNKDMLELHRQKEQEDGINGGEFEFGMNEDGTIVAENGKKRTRSSSTNGGKESKKQKLGHHAENGRNYFDDDNDDSYGAGKPHHPQILSLLTTQRKTIPDGSIYRVNTSMFHCSLRAMVISRLVSEMYPVATDKAKKKNLNDNNNMEHAGAIVNAALTFAARQEHAPLKQMPGVEESEEERHHRMSEWGTFCPAEIVPYLPPEITKSLSAQVGGLQQNLSGLLVRMCDLQYPPIIEEKEEALGHPKGGKFEVCTRQLLQRMRDRIVHRSITTHHGLVAARIVSILQMKGHCEADAIAEDAMVPVKEAREILHRLHRDKYINLFDMHMTKTHNTGTAIYLWDVIPSRLMKVVKTNVFTAILNLRLRRQHEVEVGKDWMDRAKEAGATEENAHEDDKKKYHAFCKGLERLDCAGLQLDETLMVLNDF
mmetsp:Transcript_6974/g.15396  ORF Transcript_6974/g.15396 Transcript_6974/m.15396 type:complete len:698 (-) Transcript_6974:20-2113(-)|eukprot:CAMPEP_0183740946 /NCGR_PEP_ID=MMETSP0737-20130205/60862_1 /TAXON_ID=385413 /ORGANISM="Thalassiosira miniscula, Strain CCMP1093" /LENGTH=697 /DNA_ID=CAMNT_0025976133 /DNA_START=248 /DNA_END=2341 /DNA_ORIENTATION=+